MSLNASISFTLKTPEQQEDQDYRAAGASLVKFDEYDVSKSVCLFAVGTVSPGCQHEFQSVEPIVTGWVQDNGPPGTTSNVRRIAWYLGIVFDCETGTITTNVRGKAIDGTGGGDGDGVAFQSFARDFDDAYYDTSAAWPRTCDTSGAIDNAMSDDSSFRRDSDDGAYYYGYGGSVSFGGDCGLGDCSTCTATSYLVEISSGPAATDGTGAPLTFGGSATVTRVGTTGCSYAGTGTDDDGNPIEVSLVYNGTTFGVVITRTTGGTLDIRGNRRCAGDGDASGDYSIYNDLDDLAFDIEVS